MGADAQVRRYRDWYGLLLRLYPRAFRERFGEGMVQTFHDLCRERRREGRGLFRLAMWIYFETFLELVRENTSHMTEIKKTVLRVALWSLALLMAPLVASRVVEGWNWAPGSFVFVYVLFFATGMAYALIARKMSAWAYKAGVGVALVSGFVLGWSAMVHMSETENPVNLVYFGVLAVGAIGAGLARLEARGMARALFAMAGALALAWVITQVLSVDTPAGPFWNIAVRHGGLVLVFAASGLLFRRAGMEGTK